MTDITWVVFGLGFSMFVMGCWLGQELWKMNRTLNRIAAGTQTLARIVAYYWLATPEQRANHAQEYQASVDRIRDFFESDAGHEVAQIITGQSTRSERRPKGGGR